MRNPRDFFKPLAIGAPSPPRELEFRPSRVIHFLDFSNEKMVAKAPELAAKAEILLGNLRAAAPFIRKLAARQGLIRVGKEMDLGDTQLWTRVNSFEVAPAARRSHRGLNPRAQAQRGHAAEG